MWFIELGAICVTVAVVVRVWWLVVQVLRARNKRRLLSRMFGVVSDSPDFIGISAICHDIDSVSQVADLLDVELAVHPIHSISFVRTAVGPSLRLYAREYVGRLGRFDRADGYELSRKERITLYEPLFYELRPSRYVWILTLTGMALLAGCAIAAWSFGWLPMTLLLLDILLRWGLFLWLGAVSAPFPAGKRNAALGAV